MTVRRPTSAIPFWHYAYPTPHFNGILLEIKPEDLDSPRTRRQRPGEHFDG
jgi:hypothetical protein